MKTILFVLLSCTFSLSVSSFFAIWSLYFWFCNPHKITFIFLGEKSASFKSSNMFEKVHSTLLFHGIYTNLLCKVRKAQLLIWIVVPDTFFRWFSAVVRFKLGQTIKEIFQIYFLLSYLFVILFSSSTSSSPSFRIELDLSFLSILKIVLIETPKVLMNII